MTGVPRVADLDWRGLALPLARAADALARLDERLAKSPIRDGWIARTHFLDAPAALWLEGELVHIEDLVLRDAGMDVRTPTREITRAHAVLRTRRRIARADPGWALSAAGLDALRGRGKEAASDGGDEVDDADPVDDKETFAQVTAVNRLGALTPSDSIISKDYRADRRRDPTPNNNLLNQPKLSTDSLR